MNTPAGILMREIPNAWPLSDTTDQGTAAEEAVHDAAAIWGLPDFTYRGKVVSVGRGARELGDNLIIVGELGVVVQVKSRVDASDDHERERQWIEKRIAEGLAQSRGTIRRLKFGPVELTNARGRTVEVDGSRLRWISVVVINHDTPPLGLAPPPYDPDTPAVVMLRRDWEFLWGQLRSTHAFGAYLERISGDPITLGEEPLRYFQLAIADHETEPGEPDPVLIAAGGRIVAGPVLPLSGEPDDRGAHLLVRALLEDIALIRLPADQEADRLAGLAELDRLPVNQRATIGRFLIEGLAEIVEVDADEVQWRIRRFVGGRESTHLAFGVCSQSFSDVHMDAFAGWVRLRHHDYQQIRGTDPDDLMTVGVLLSPRADGRRAFDTTMCTVRGIVEFSDQELGILRELWPDPGEEP